MGEAVFLPHLLFGLRRPSTGAYWLLGWARSRWENGGLQESSRRWVLHRITATSVLVPTVSHSLPPPPQETLQYQQVGLAQPLMRSPLFSLCPGAHETRVPPPRVEFLFPPVLWDSSDQTPLVFKARFSRGSSSHCQAPMLESLTWGSELSLLWVNFCGKIIFQFVGHPSSVYGIWFYHDCVPLTVWLWLLLCLWI